MLELFGSLHFLWPNLNPHLDLMAWGPRVCSWLWCFVYQWMRFSNWIHYRLITYSFYLHHDYDHTHKCTAWPASWIFPVIRANVLHMKMLQDLNRYELYINNKTVCWTWTPPHSSSLSLCEMKASLCLWGGLAVLFLPEYGLLWTFRWHGKIQS